MFTNRISARELLKSSQSTQDRRLQSDFSQLQNAQFTQFELSHENSQDFFSQPDQGYPTGSSTESQGRRASSTTYEKYLSSTSHKPSLFRNSGSQSSMTQDSSQTVKPVSNFQHQLSSQKARAKERDERDMLSGIVTIVKEWSEEVKQSLCLMKTSEEDNRDILRRTLTDAVEESSNKIVKALNDQQKQSAEISALNRELRQKDEKIQELLQKSVDANNSGKETSAVIETMKVYINEQQMRIERKIQSVVEGAQEQLQQSIEMVTKHASNLEENNQLGVEAKHTNLHRQIQEVEKGLVAVLQSLKYDIDRQNRDMEGFFINKMQSLQQKYARELDESLHKGLSETVENLCGYVGNPDSITADMQELLLSQQNHIVKCVKTNTSEQTKNILKQNQELNNRQGREYKNIQKCVEEQFESLRSDQELFMEEIKTSLEECKMNSVNIQERPRENDILSNVSKKVQEQLENFNKKHQAELERLESQIQTQRVQNEQLDPKWNMECSDCNSRNTKPIDSNLYCVGENEVNATGDCKFTRDQRGKEDSRFLAPCPPKGLWTRQSLFGRAKPSPLATVFPQRQSKPSTSDQQWTSGIQGNQLAVQPIQKQVNNQSIQEHNSKQLRSRLVSQEQERNVQAVSAFRKNSRHSQDEYTAPVTRGHSRDEYTALVTTDSTVSNDFEFVTNQTQKENCVRKRKGKKRSKTNKAKKAANTLPQNSNISHSMLPQRELGQRFDLENVTRNDKRLHMEKVVPSISTEARDVYDFHEETSTQSVYSRPKHPVGMVKTYERKNDAWLNTIESSSSDTSSHQSSPSIAVSDLLIRRVVRCDRRLPEKKGFSTSQKATPRSYLMDTKDLTEFSSKDSDQSPPQNGPIRSVEKRKLIDYDTLLFQMVQQKMRRF